MLEGEAHIFCSIELIACQNDFVSLFIINYSYSQSYSAFNWDAPKYGFIFPSVNYSHIKHDNVFKHTGKPPGEATESHVIHALL